MQPVENLKKLGYNIKVADFPQYENWSSVFVQKYLTGEFGTADEVNAKCASIFYAIDRYVKAPELKKWLEEGYIIISNRYVSASKGHQTGKIKDKELRKKFVDWLIDLEYNIFNIPRPDKVFFVHMPCIVGQQLVNKKEDRTYLEQGKKKDIHETDINHLRDAELAYIELVDRFDYWEKIECTKPGISTEKINNKSIDPIEKVKSIESISKDILQKTLRVIEN